MSNLEILIPAANQNTSMEAHAERYKAIGLSPHGIPFKEKGPLIQGWQAGDHSATVKDGMNIGCRINDLVDVDVDLHSAGPFMAAFSATSFVFGRESAKCTHYLFRTEGAESKEYKVTEDFAEKFLPKNKNGKAKTMVVEIRTGGFQTVFPPSTHESGELIRFETVGSQTCNEDPEVVSFSEIKRMVALTAIMGVISYMWPKVEHRQLALTSALGVMRRHFKATQAETEKFFAPLLKGDEELKMRNKAFASVFKSNRVHGWKKFKEHFPVTAEDISAFCSWVGDDEAQNADAVAKLKEKYKVSEVSSRALLRASFSGVSIIRTGTENF